MTPARPRGRLGRAALGCQPDSRLVALVREGSDRAFEEIVHRYRRRLVAYAGGIVGQDRAEDVVQESLVRALAAIRRRDADISLRPWLYTIVRNRALNDRRDQPSHERLDEDFDGVPQPPEIAARREELAGVVDRVKALPAAQREALVQRELEGRSHEEIAAALTVTPGAVRGLIFRARSALRDAAGLLIPMPVLRALAQSSAVGDGAAVLAAGGGAGGLVKLGTALTIAAVTVGGGVALHDQGGKGDQAKADPPPAARRDGHGATAGKAVPTAAGVEVGDDRGGGPGRDGGSDSSGPGSGGSGSSGSGSGGSGSSGPGSGGSGSSGPGSGGSGSSGSGSDGSGSSGSGSDGSGSSGPGPGGSASSVSGSAGDDSTSGGSGSSSGPGPGSSSGSSGSGSSNDGPGSGSGSGSSGSLSSGSGSSGSGISGSGDAISSEGSGSPTTTTSTTTTSTTTTTTTGGNEGPGGGDSLLDGGGSDSSGSGSGTGSSGSG